MPIRSGRGGGGGGGLTPAPQLATPQSASIRLDRDVRIVVEGGLMVTVSEEENKLEIRQSWAHDFMLAGA